VHGLDIGISNIPFDVDGCVFIGWFDLFAAAVAGSLVALFTLFLRAPAVGTMLPNRSRSNPLARIDDAAERAWSAEWNANILARETIVVTPEAKDHLWSALTSLASHLRRKVRRPVYRCCCSRRCSNVRCSAIASVVPMAVCYAHPGCMQRCCRAEAERWLELPAFVATRSCVTTDVSAS
jgi:hypothetical protein